MARLAARGAVRFEPRLAARGAVRFEPRLAARGAPLFELVHLGVPPYLIRQGT